jgi:hypothetical protein
MREAQTSQMALCNRIRTCRRHCLKMTKAEAPRTRTCRLHCLIESASAQILFPFLSHGKFDNFPWQTIFFKNLLCVVNLLISHGAQKFVNFRACVVNLIYHGAQNFAKFYACMVNLIISQGRQILRNLSSDWASAEFQARTGKRWPFGADDEGVSDTFIKQR